MKKVIFGFTCLCIGLFYYLWHWESPSLNRDHTKSAHDALYISDHYGLSFSTMGNQIMVNVAPNAPQEAINPHFPIIHMKALAPHNAWLHLVRTDNKYIKWQKFIDSAEDNKDIYPFYSLNQDFYNTPMWNYRFFEKPLSYWNGYAYAVQVDKQAKTIKCVGGIVWGFALPRFAFRPTALDPKALSQAEWRRDWLIFKEQLPGYTLAKDY